MGPSLDSRKPQHALQSERGDLVQKESRGQSARVRGGLRFTLPYLFTLISTYLLLRPGANSSESTPFGDFRGYFPFDQLTYAAIATNSAAGNLALVEPFTETGTSYYPSLWYMLLGVFSKLFGVGIPAAWTLLGAISVASTLVVVGYTAYRVSGRWWAPALVGPALWIGPIAIAIGKSWYLPLQSHALLWGPYGELFSLNAEAVGIGAGAVALMLLLLASLRSPKSRISAVLVATAGLLIGILANIHTYSFLVTVGFVASWTATVGIVCAPRSTRRYLLVASLGIVAAVAIVGTTVTVLRESLGLFALMLLAAVPGGAWVLRLVPRLAIVGLACFVIASAPQIVHVFRGMVGSDPFLAYRQVQSASLGIGPLPFIIATLPMALWVLALTLAARRSALPKPISSSVGAGLIALTLLSFNDVWGFAQEPYRMWIASLTLTALVAVPLTAWTLTTVHNIWPDRTIRYTLVTALILTIFSWWNVGGFRAFVNDLEPISFGSSRLTALQDLTQNRGGLFASDPCVDPLQLKIVSKERVAFYNAGLAWPSNRSALDQVISDRRNGILNADALRRAGVTFLVTDSSCSNAWEESVSTDFALISEATYGMDDNPSVLRLWILQ